MAVMTWTPDNSNTFTTDDRPNDDNFIPFHDVVTHDEGSEQVQYRWIDKDGNEVCGTSIGNYQWMTGPITLVDGDGNKHMIDEAAYLKARQVEKAAEYEATRIELECILRAALMDIGSNAPVHVLNRQFDDDAYALAQGPGNEFIAYMIIRNPEHVMDNPCLYAKIIEAQQKSAEYTPNAQEIAKQRTKRAWEEWVRKYFTMTPQDRMRLAIKNASLRLNDEAKSV